MFDMQARRRMLARQQAAQEAAALTVTDFSGPSAPAPTQAARSGTITRVLPAQPALGRLRPVYPLPDKPPTGLLRSVNKKSRPPQPRPLTEAEMDRLLWERQDSLF